MTSWSSSSPGPSWSPRCELAAGRSLLVVWAGQEVKPGRSGSVRDDVVGALCFYTAAGYLAVKSTRPSSSSSSITSIRTEVKEPSTRPGLQGLEQHGEFHKGGGSERRLRFIFTVNKPLTAKSTDGGQVPPHSAEPSTP